MRYYIYGMKLNKKTQDLIIWIAIGSWFAGIAYLLYRFG